MDSYGLQPWSSPQAALLQTISTTTASFSTVLSMVLIVYTSILLRRERTRYKRQASTNTTPCHETQTLQTPQSPTTPQSPITPVTPVTPTTARSLRSPLLQTFSEKSIWRRMSVHNDNSYTQTTIPTRVVVIPLAIGDVLASAAKIAGQRTFGNHTHCNIQAAFITFGNFASLNLVFAMCILLFLSVTPTHRFWTVHQLSNNAIWFCLACYLVPLFMAILPLIVQRITSDPIYGPSNLWCWVEPRWSSWQIGLWFVWLQVAFCVNVFVYIYVLVKLSIAKKRSTMRASAFKRYYWIYLRNIALYSLAFVISWTPAVTVRLYQMVHGHSTPPYWMLVLQATLGPLRGLTNFLCYFLTSIHFIHEQANTTTEPRSPKLVAKKVALPAAMEEVMTKEKLTTITPFDRSMRTFGPRPVTVTVQDSRVMDWWSQSVATMSEQGSRIRFADETDSRDSTDYWGRHSAVNADLESQS